MICLWMRKVNNFDVTAYKITQKPRQGATITLTVAFVIYVYLLRYFKVGRQSAVAVASDP